MLQFHFSVISEMGQAGKITKHVKRNIGIYKIYKMLQEFLSKWRKSIMLHCIRFQRND